MHHIKLSDFWPHAPQLWFSQTECRFAAHGIANEFAHYCFVVGALPHDSLRRVADIVETPPQDTPYTTIKHRLLGAHQMTDCQRAEKLYLSPPIGDRKPSEMMAAMLEMCPRGEEKTNLFACLFLQRLPREIRVFSPEWTTRTPSCWWRRQTPCGHCMGSLRRLPPFRRLLICLSRLRIRRWRR
jgi:hypothetical protein